MDKHDQEFDDLMKVKATDQKDIYYVIGKSQMDKYDRLISLVIILAIMMIVVTVVGVLSMAWIVNWFDNTDWFYRLLLASESC